MNRFKRIFGKVSALALLAGLLFIIYAVAIGPVVTRVFDTRERIAEQRILLGRLTSVSEQTGIAATLETPSKSATADSAFLPGASDAIRIAELQSLLNQVAEAEGALLKSTRALQPRNRDSVRLLGIEVQFNASIEQIQRILFKLETGLPNLFIESLQVTPQTTFSPTGDPDLSKLEVRLAVTGAARQKKG